MRKIWIALFFMLTTFLGTSNLVLAEETKSKITKVMLFADPREAETSCGCAEIIRLARESKNGQNVTFEEVDIRKISDKYKKYKVMVSPTVIFLGKNDSIINRFQGEGSGVIKKLRHAIKKIVKK
ncbi:MAG: hypothetical protein CME65_10430 [Halobacteriovoraceae bacterium]|nr:hypothetical protein [Halobacteriovoraceae bacterium]|tara:strand:+ start:537 stop:911 length:375 start_codon:yes stop_codon:yes gene_type:complete